MSKVASTVGKIAGAVATITAFIPPLHGVSAMASASAHSSSAGVKVKRSRK